VDKPEKGAGEGYCEGMTATREDQEGNAATTKDPLLREGCHEESAGDNEWVPLEVPAGKPCQHTPHACLYQRTHE